jgi:LPS-assembly protein
MFLALSRAPRRRRSLLLGSLAAALLHAGPLAAQDPGDRPTPAAPAPVPPAGDGQIAFSADDLDYDSKADVVTASGNVQVVRAGNRLRADKVVWNRRTGAITASGDVSVTNPNGDIAYGDSVDVTDTLRDGLVENLLIVLGEGGRLAAARGTREGPVYVLDRAAFSPCAVEDARGCPKNPSWQIRATRVTYDSARERVRYRGARIELFGLPLLPLPGLAHPVGQGGGSGLLVPDIRIDRNNGFEIALPYYWQLAPNRDLTVTPHLFTNVAPLLEGSYRALLSRGAYSVTGFATYSSRTSVTTTNSGPSDQRLRGYIGATGKVQLDPLWSLTGSLRRTTDRTFLRRYDISDDDRLRSTLHLDRQGERSYLAIAGWATQTLRTGDSQGQQPIALPEIDWRLRLPAPMVGGTLQLQANSLALTRTSGQDTQRAFAGATWTLSRITGWGQEVGLTGYVRGDVYHSDQNDLTPALYAGRAGWRTRGIAALAADVRMPFIGRALGGVQRITPRVQIVAAPHLSNLSIPNEDARAVELEDSNLFALNRFPGYDRFEDSSRVTYGVDYALDIPNLAIRTTIGQSYRLNRRPSILPDGTGLSGRLSDIVGRTTVRYRDFVTLTHRFRLDKGNLAVRRNELDATVGSRKTYATLSYLRLNRNIVAGVEDLRDREEVRAGARVAFARYWSLFGSAVIDLTGRRDDPTALGDGYDPVRHRLGIAYSDDCIEVALTWRRIYRQTGDARRGNSYLLRLAFKNLGI